MFVRRQDTDNLRISLSEYQSRLSDTSAAYEKVEAARLETAEALQHQRADYAVLERRLAGVQGERDHARTQLASQLATPPQVAVAVAHSLAPRAFLRQVMTPIVAAQPCGNLAIH